MMTKNGKKVIEKMVFNGNGKWSVIDIIIFMTNEI